MYKDICVFIKKQYLSTIITYIYLSFSVYAPALTYRCPQELESLTKYQECVINHLSNVYVLLINFIYLRTESVSYNNKD